MQQKIALTIISFALAGTIQAQIRATDFQLTKITRNFIASPDYNYSGAETYRANTRDRWLEVEAEFAATPQFTPELTFKYYVLLAGQVLSGEVTHVNIPAGRELRSAMYLSPRGLAHFMGN